jgi:predicted dehydrogenase
MNPPPVSAEPRIRGAVVGVGHMGQYHALALAELWGVDLVGVVDVDFAKAEQVAAPYGVRAFGSHRDVFGLVDFASVAVPTEQHFEVARDLLEAGVHVLVEKPMTPSLEEAKELFRIARQRKRILHVRHVERFNGAVQELRKIVERPILIESRRLGPFVPRVQDDSVVMDLMIHDIDIVLGLANSRVTSVDAVGTPLISDTADIANARAGTAAGPDPAGHGGSARDSRGIEPFRGELPHPQAAGASVGNVRRHCRGRRLPAGGGGDRARRPQRQGPHDREARPDRGRVRRLGGH